MFRCIALISLCIANLLLAESSSPPILKTTDLLDFEKLPEARKKLIETALHVATEVRNKPYTYGGDKPQDGGFDCSGAMHYVLQKAGFKPPRTSPDQYTWIQKNSKLHMIPNSAKDINDPIFASLKPGDLLFWTGTFEPNDNRQLLVTHIAMFLGYEKHDKHPVIINASDARNYRGITKNGYGVFDFEIPSAKSKSRLIAYGSPPGLR